jgi:putative hydrolase of the HAD superfamily
VAVDAVIFDWGGTLTPWHTIVAADAWQAAVSDPEIARRLADAEAVLWQRQQNEHRSGSMDEVLAAAGVEPSPELVDQFHAWWDPHTCTDPDASALLRALRERDIKIGVLSNTIWPRDRHEGIFTRDGISELIDAAVYTSEIEWTKPHPEAFRAILAALGVQDGRRAVFVGDRRFDDIYGAQSVGMRAVLIPHSEIPDDQRGHTDGEPDAVIDRLADLLPIIDTWRVA